MANETRMRHEWSEPFMLYGIILISIVRSVINRLHIVDDADVF